MEVGLEIDVKDIPAKTFDGVVERKDMNTLSVFYILTGMYDDKIAKLHSQVVAGYFVHLYPTLFYIIRTETDEDGFGTLLATKKAKIMSLKVNKQGGLLPNDDSISSEELKCLHCCRIDCGD